jgi:hypothetical protein
MTTRKGGKRMESRNRHNGDSPESEDVRDQAFAMMADAQERIKAGVEKAAEVMPEAVAGAQVAARDTQRRLDEMSDQNLLAGASFSLGLAIGLFISGTNRLLVAITLVPAAAMLSTLMGREKQAKAYGERATGRRGSKAES